MVAADRAAVVSSGTRALEEDEAGAYSGSSAAVEEAAAARFGDLALRFLPVGLALGLGVSSSI